MKITKNKTYTKQNLIKFSCKATFNELYLIMKSAEAHIKANCAERTGDIITAPHVLYLETGIWEMDVYVPIDRPIPSTENFEYMPIFQITNCIMTKHEKDPRLLPAAYTDIYHQAKAMGLGIEHPFYNVFKGDIDRLWGCGEGDVDVYVVSC